MRILFLGDVVGGGGRAMLQQHVRAFKRGEAPGYEGVAADAVVVNAENCAAGSGITRALAKEIFESGVDAITLGDHTWGQKEFPGEIGSVPNLVRPANFPSESPGRGWCVVTMPTFSFAILNLHGRVFMNPVDCPFKAADRALNEMPKNVPVFVDFHCEATSEKNTMGHYLDGRVTAMVGTHTHVQTSDARLLPKGTAYITDLGMCGPYVSSIGRDLSPVTKKFVTGIPARFNVAGGPRTLEGAFVEFEAATKRAVSISSVRIREPYP